MTDMVKAFDGHVRNLIADIAEEGYHDAISKWSDSFMCGCMGPRNGEPFCSCLMRCKTVEIVVAMRKKVIEAKLDELKAAVS